MSKAIENLEAAQRQAMAIRPKVGGFPYLAETLRRAGVTRNVWFLPACQSLYLTNQGPVLTQGKPLATGTVDVPPFNREALISALRTDQAGQSSFPEFLDQRSLNINTFNVIYVLMGHALPEEAQSRPVQRAGETQAGVHAQVSNRGETAHSSGSVSFGFAVWPE